MAATFRGTSCWADGVVQRGTEHGADVDQSARSCSEAGCLRYRDAVDGRRISPDDAEETPCRSCGRSVANAREARDIFEGMHWVCFHYAFEHEISQPTDVDADCGQAGCPSAQLMSTERDLENDSLLAAILDALRTGAVTAEPTLDVLAPGRLMVRTTAATFTVTVSRSPLESR